MSAAYDREQYVHPYTAHTLFPEKLYTLTTHRQNNTRLSELSSKVSALRGVTVDIYDNARDQHVIDNSVCLPAPFLNLRFFPLYPLLTTCPNVIQSEVFSSMTSSIKGSAGRLGRMAQQGNKVAIFKLAGIIIGVVVVLWWGLSFLFRSRKA